MVSEARALLPSGITHDSRYTRPYGIYVDRAEGPRKWDVDGNAYIDYFGGHGALLLGHRHPDVERSVHRALSDGTHFGANHVREVDWARAAQRLMPSLQLIRFTASGTEATHMAFRLARAYTGKSRIMRFRTHFHGWHDHMAFGVSNHFDGTPSPGVLPELAEQMLLADPSDLSDVKQALIHDGDVAAVILEPTGGGGGGTPLDQSFLHDLRDLTAKYGVLLIFDEVVTGFRVSPGGAQALYGVTPDLTTLAKILAGGLPGGAVGGRSEILAHLDFEWALEAGAEKIHHPGTFNANPVSAAAGTTALGIIAETDACQRAIDFGTLIRQRLNELFVRRGVAWAAYGVGSSFHIYMNLEKQVLDPLDFNPLSVSFQTISAKSPDVLNKWRLALLLGGVDVSGVGSGVISATHDGDALEKTIQACDDALSMLLEEEVLPRL